MRVWRENPLPESPDVNALQAAKEPVATVSAQERSFIATVARNSGFVIGAQVVMKAMAFLFNIFIVRRLGDVHFGQYAAVTGFIDIFAIFSDLGMVVYMLREIARDRTATRWILPNVIVMRLLLSAGVVIVATSAAYVLGKSSDMVLGIFIAACGLFAYSFQGPIDTTLVAWERLDVVAGFMLVQQLVFWGLGTAALLLGWGFMGLIVASFVAVLCMAALEGRIVLRHVPLREMTVTPRRWKGLVKAGLPFGISGLSFALQGRFDSVLMSFLLTDAIVGWYNVPMQLVGMLLLLASSFCTAVFPSVTRAYKEDPDSIYGIVHRTFKYLLMLSLPMAVGGTILADKLIITLYTQEFAASVPLMRILIWTLPTLYLSELTGVLINVLEKEKAGAKANVINAVLSVVLGVVLVPTLGVTGAAVGRTAARLIRLGQYWRLLGSELLVGKRWRELVGVVLAAAAMGAVLLFLPGLNLFLAIGVGVVVYLVLLFVFGAVDRDELVQLTRLLRPQSKTALG
jgi:O-antigen/teichoic acid export membrane protein